MSDRIVTGIRLLRAFLKAQREHDASERLPYTGQGSAEWMRTRDALDAAKRDLDAFEIGNEADWKLKQAGDR